MNKADIKQIILEEIETALSEIESLGGDDLIAKRVAQAVLAVEDDGVEEMAGRASDYTLGADKVAQLKPEFAKMKPKERARAILQFLLRVRDQIEAMPKGRGRGRKLFSDEDLVNLAKVMSKETFSSKDLINAVGRFNKPQQVNPWIAGLRAKGFLDYVSRDSGGDDSEPAARAGSAAGSKDRADLFKGLEEHIRKQITSLIEEGKNPLANRMKEIETQGRVAALETKLSAISEFIDETQARLTRIDEDEEFNEMMDKSKVKEVRKQLKELERAKLKLEKEMAKMEGKKAKKVVKDEPEQAEQVDEAGPEDDMEGFEDMLDGFYDGDGEPFELNESVKRMQKLANLRD